MTDNRGPWMATGYADVVSAVRIGSDLEVTFANGDVVLLPASTFGVVGDFDVTIDPDDPMTVDLVSRGILTRTLPWTVIRSAADQAFAQELRHQEAHEARRVGLRLKALREDKNLNQKDLARIAGMTSPQLSKIESGALDMRMSTVQSLLRAMGGSFADIAGDAPEVSRKAIVRSAEKLGVPRDVLTALLEATPRKRLAAMVERAFGWDLAALTANTLQPEPLPAGVAFKAHSPASLQSSPLVPLAGTIASIVRQATKIRQAHELPTDPRQVHAEARDADGLVTLQSLAVWLWSRGIPVVPLRGKGAFSAAVWNDAGTPVIVLKETRELAAYWLFDLAHECGHLALGHVGESGLVDVDAPTPQPSADAAEQAANQFALEVLVPNHRDLLTEIRKEAKGSHLRFKGAVAVVAERAKVNAGVLGLIAAYELKEIGEPKDRWGSATNLARVDGPGADPIQAIAAKALAATTLDEVDTILLGELVTQHHGG